MYCGRIFSSGLSPYGESDGMTKCCMPMFDSYLPVMNADRDGVHIGATYMRFNWMPNKPRASIFGVGIWLDPCTLASLKPLECQDFIESDEID